MDTEPLFSSLIFRTLFRSRRLFEYYFWALLSLLVGMRFLMATSHWGFEKSIDIYFWDFIIAVSILIFPAIFYLIFSKLPFEHLRSTRIKKSYIVNNIYSVNENTIGDQFSKEEDQQTQSGQPNPAKSETHKPVEDVELTIISRYSRNAETLSEKIYNRSGVYLLIGCLIAFGGVLFFSVATTYLHVDPKSVTGKIDWSEIFLENYVPRIGTLIFIETIAFFFLRQYRVTMEDYRYYEAIKRQRENQYLTLQIFKSYAEKTDVAEKTIDKCSFNWNPNKIKKEESTQFLEASKLNLEEKDLIDKVVEILKLAKK